MSSPADERMDALSDALARMLRRLDIVDQRLSRLEAGQGIPQAAPPSVGQTLPSVNPPPVPTAPPPAREMPPPSPPLPAAPPPIPVPRFAAGPEVEPESTDRLETRVGLTWINRIGVLTLVLAVAFFFKYAVDNQWIGEAGRVMLGVVAAFAILGLAEFIFGRGHRTYAQGITGAGIAILYLSFYASFGFYSLVPQGVAFLLMALTTAMAGVLAIRYRAAAISVLGLIGGYLTPVLLSTNVDRPWAFFGYLLVLNVGAVAVARSQRWRPLEYLVFGGTALLYASWFADRFLPEKQLVATVFALAFYALFCLMESPALPAAAQLLASVALLAIWPAPLLNYLWLSLALAAAGLLLSEWRGWLWGPAAAFGGFWACTIVWQAELFKPPQLGAIIAALTVGFLLFLGWSAWRTLVERAAARQQDLVIVALNAAAYFGAGYHLLRPDYNDYLGLFAAALAAIHLALGVRIWKTAPEAGRDVRPVLLYLGVALCFLTLAVPIQFSGYRITMAWALEGAALAWIGVRTGSNGLVNAAMLVFLLTLGRLHILDAGIYSDPAQYHAIANARFLTFFVAAICLWLAARWIASGTLVLAPYVAGHYVLLWALAMEVLGSAARNAAEGNAANVAMVSLSALMAAYGLALVVLGVVTRAGINRILGLGLLALVVLKLYFYDVWQLGKIYRVVAFGFLGVLLLITSFLYSRYRTNIENWWRDEETRS
ncbi:MAG: DUF2339 domain-containing protein [Acidobacteriia bacterium]|nr:DUF2339 domain-containing protein [Terriglobia bacterium]